MSYARASADCSCEEHELGQREAKLVSGTMQSLEQTNEVASRAVATLKGQTEQLSRIEADSDASTQSLDESGWLLRSLKPFGWVKNMWSSNPSSRRTEQARGLPREAEPSVAGAAAAPAPGCSNALSGPVSGRGAAGITSAAASYDQLDELVQDLKLRSSEIHAVLSQHNEALRRLDATADRNCERTREQMRDIKKL